MAKEVVGWIEKVRIFPGDLTVKAKIDTGAKTSSIHCGCTHYKKNGEKWVRFSVTNEQGKTNWFERKIIRTATIKRHFGKAQERSVIKLGFCLGSVYQETEVNLVDRSGLNYQLLVGREFLKGVYLVDPENMFLSEPDCKGETIETGFN